MKYTFCIIVFVCAAALLCAQEKTIWTIGKADNSAKEFALAPNGFKKFIEKDFGYEDNYFVVGHSKVKKDFPYVLPGPVDTWGGTWNTSGWRTNQVNVFFGIKQLPQTTDGQLVIKLTDYAKTFLPLLKVTINDQEQKIQLDAPGYDLFRQKAPTMTEPLADTASLTGDLALAIPKTIKIPLKPTTLKKGGNTLSLTVLEGSWIMFDQIKLEVAEKIKLITPEQFFLMDVKPADYELTLEATPVQPLLVSVGHLTGSPRLSVLLDGQKIFSETIEDGHYQFEAPMPAVHKETKSVYQILENDQIIAEGIVIRRKQNLQTLADYVDTRIGTGHSRWMIAPGPWMPFSMIKMSPDNQNAGWQAGYQPSYESIGTFSSIHEWTLGGLGILATNGPLKTKIGDEFSGSDNALSYRSKIDKTGEEAPIGYYQAQLLDYDIKAEITATTRCGFLKFTFPPERDSARIVLDLHIPAEYDYILKAVEIKKISDTRIEGISHQHSARVWSNDADQDYRVYFIVEFDQPMQQMGVWLDNKIIHAQEVKEKDLFNAGVFVQFEAKKYPEVQVRMAISYVSLANADLNLNTEVITPFGWNFNLIRANQVAVWNDIFNRIKITTTNRLEKVRFYNSMYRSVCGRNTFSDVNGQWRGTDGSVHKLKNQDDVALGCDAFWNTFWNLNQFWNLVTPEWSNRWVNSQLAMYDAYGWLAKGPAGMNYIPVMVAEHEIPLMVSAYQMGIRDFDAHKALEACIKMQTTPAQKLFNGFAGNRDLKSYLQHHYVPSDKGRFSNSMEYSFDDWTVGQLAKALGDDSTYTTFHKRGYWWKNVIDAEGFCHLRRSTGEWEEKFDPFRSGANHHYVEGNAWQLTFFVPQDIPALVEKVGRKKFAERLDWGFAASEPWRYNGMNDQYWDYPVVQGNQQSMHFSFLFNWAGKPWLTQKWTRSIIDRYYGFGVGNAYLGDEDQGQMSGWLVMAALGLFQVDGGCRTNPIYEIASPMYKKVEIDLGHRFGRGDKFVITANNASRRNKYVQKATLNGQPLHTFYFPASDLLRGGELILEMGATPNEDWGQLD